MRIASRLVPLVLVSVALVGCGRTMNQVARPIGGAKAAPASAVGTRAVAPDDTKVLTEDDRRANYWSGGDAVRVMAVHTTALNTTSISAAANVYLSPSRFHDSKPCVFVARHYGFASVAQYQEIPDYNRLAYNLKPLPAAGYAVNAKLAFDLARGFAPPAPAAGQPANRAEGSVFLSSRAILVHAGSANPQWRFYASEKKYAIDAITKEILAPTPQVNPKDPLNGGAEVDIQRAAAVFLPTSLSQANDRREPKPTN